MIFNALGEVTHMLTIIWSDELRLTTIFFKELLAAIITIEHIIEINPDNPVIHIAIDNTAAYHVLRRMYSSNLAALQLVLRLRRRMGSTHELRVTSIRGVDNVADDVSRNRLVIDEARREATWRQMRLAQEGLPHIGDSSSYEHGVMQAERHAEDEDLTDLGPLVYLMTSEEDMGEPTGEGTRLC